MLSPVTGGFYYGKIVAGIAREVALVGGHVVLMQTLDAGLHSDEVVAAPDFETPTAWSHLDGIISISSATSRNYLHRLRAAGKAIVLASDEIDGFAAPTATPDNKLGVAEAVHHLIEHGHTRIGYAANLIQPDMRARHEAYRTAMSDAGLDPHDKWFFDAFDNGELGGRDVAQQVVAAGMPITALILATDRNAIGCIAQFSELGVAIPGDIAIVGFDGLQIGAYTRPTLSTVVATVRRDRRLGGATGVGTGAWRSSRSLARTYRRRGSCREARAAAPRTTRRWTPTASSASGATRR